MHESTPSTPAPDRLRAGISALAGGGDSPAALEATHLAARSVDALTEVAEWAADGQAADPTACAWLSLLRWLRAEGATSPSDAPVPPPRNFDDQFPVLAGPAGHPGDSFHALATGRFGEVARPILPDATSPEVIVRAIPYGLIPGLPRKELIRLVIDAAALTHGNPEAQSAAACAAVVVATALAHGPESSSVLETAREAAATITRPAPITLGFLEELLGQQSSAPASAPARATGVRDAATPVPAASAALVAALAEVTGRIPAPGVHRAVANDDAVAACAAILAAVLRAVRDGTPPTAAEPRRAGELARLGERFVALYYGR